MRMLMIQMEGNISEEQLGKLRAISGVAAAHPVAPLRVPISLRGEIMENALQTDSFIWGVSRELIADDLAKGMDFEPVDWRSGKERVPAIVPAFFIDMFNSGFARASSLPQLNRDAAAGRKFDLLLNTTTLIEGRGEKKTVPSLVAGIADDASLLAVMMPLQTVQEMNAWNDGRRAGTPDPGYLAVYLDLENLGAYDAVLAQIEALGLRAEGNRELAGTARFLTLGAAALLTGLGVMVALIAAINVFNSFALLMMERRAQIGLFAAIGGSRGLLARLYLSEALAASVAGAGAGSLAAWLLLGRLEAAAFAALPKLTFLPERALWLSPALPALIIVSLAILCVLASLPPLLAAANRPPGEIVSGANP
jgi:putative ABC transport system permease protein